MPSSNPAFSQPEIKPRSSPLVLYIVIGILGSTLAGSAIYFFAVYQPSHNDTSPTDDTDNTTETDCGVQECHGMNLTCGSNVAEMCTEIYQIGDRCRQYASCEVVNGTCTFEQESNNYFDQCKSCVEQCEIYYDNSIQANSDNLFLCEENCSEESGFYAPSEVVNQALFNEFISDISLGSMPEGQTTIDPANGLVPTETSEFSTTGQFCVMTTTKKEVSSSRLGAAIYNVITETYPMPKAVDPHGLPQGGSISCISNDFTSGEYEFKLYIDDIPVAVLPFTVTSN